MDQAPVDLVIRNGRVVSPESTVAAGIAVQDGVIVTVAEDGRMPPARRTIDAQGRYFLMSL